MIQTQSQNEEIRQNYKPCYMPWEQISSKVCEVYYKVKNKVWSDVCYEVKGKVFL